jgi:alcohol dehydrogenase class IV
MAQGIALEGMRQVKENLPRVHADGGDIEARGHMMSAAAMGAVSFQKGLGAIHALSHPVGAIYDSHHGTTNAVVMPAVLRFNREAIEARIAAAAAYLGIAGGFDGFYDWVVALKASLGIPEDLNAFGIEHARLDDMAGMAIADPTAGGNPVPLTREAALSLYEACL